MSLLIMFQAEGTTLLSAYIWCTVMLLCSWWHTNTLVSFEHFTQWHINLTRWWAINKENYSPYVSNFDIVQQLCGLIRIKELIHLAHGDTASGWRGWGGPSAQFPVLLRPHCVELPLRAHNSTVVITSSNLRKQHPLYNTTRIRLEGHKKECLNTSIQEHFKAVRIEAWPFITPCAST